MPVDDSPPKPRSASEMLSMARGFLQRKGVEEWRLEGEILVAHALTLSRLQLFMQLDRPVTGREIDRARDLLVRRGRHEPTAYITGRREFYGRGFAVGPGVLIPRPETELLVDRARALVPAMRARPAARASASAREEALAHASNATGAASSRRARIADVGTGSGCVAITLALEISDADVYAIDVSPFAVERARSNARDLGALVDVREGDAIPELCAIAAQSGARFDLIVSNPPYVTRDEAGVLAPEVREHEPELALFAPDGDPDHWVRALLDAAKDVLSPSGTLLVELGASQAARALVLARERGWQARTHRDLAGIERVLEARREGADDLWRRRQEHVL
jgi:release factor glutamine methyltransferase